MPPFPSLPFPVRIRHRTIAVLTSVPTIPAFLSPFFRLSFAILGSGKFHFDYADNHQERVLVIEGEAELTPDDGAAKIIISAGDYVVFHQGFACGQ